ncbi:TPA: BMC domain-containing protein [Streptococcus suis]|nr:BMC domain-containing protein [Streptococcus suis]HEM6121187.1 BMC domain-containing protein [Streptococcus suis]HEM6238139.1 BMC domain-containing protein [Streptococcus suis]HEM6262270.1 BMC domain-containing protein [Streptococcus suis]HEM6419665.1 BMC domain-containing protein [Streptococcus suis]
MERYQAIGAVETFGLVYALEAADAMVKASDVEVIAYVNTASGYIAVIVQGETAACKTAVDAGVLAVEKLGTEVYSKVVIPGPHEDLRKIIDRYSLSLMFPDEANQ